MRTRAVAAAFALLLAGCKTPIAPPESVVAGLAGATKVYTLTNLHPDASKGVVSAANLQGRELIPVCSEVTLTLAYPGWLQFKVNATGKEYVFRDHHTSGEPFDKNLARYFGRACPKAQLDALTPEEREAVRLGVPKKGIRKDAVILAMGYPPARDTFDLAMPRWRYWDANNRFFTLTFDPSGRVEDIFY